MTVIDSFIEWAHSGLLNSETAMSYMRGRGVSIDQCMRHKLGYVENDYCPDPTLDPGHSSICGDRSALNKWCDSCRLIGWSSSWENVDGLWTQCTGRRMHGCVVMPLTSYSRSIVGFQLRSIIEKKFDSFHLLRKPEGHFFGIASNIDFIWAKKEVFVVEGPFDQLVFERLVSRNVIGLTTNVPNSIQVRFFRRFVDWVGIFSDEDKAGRDGAITFEMRMVDGGPAVQRFRVDVKRRDGRKCKDLNEAWSVLGDKRFSDRFTGVIRNEKR